MSNSLWERAERSVNALRTPDASLQRVPNTVRQSIADVIEELLVPMPSAAQAPSMREALEDVSNWLEGCLTCKTWAWDGLQREAAEQALAEAKTALAAQPPAAPVDTETRFHTDKDREYAAGLLEDMDDEQSNAADSRINIVAQWFCKARVETARRVRRSSADRARALHLLAAEDARQDKLQEILETIREQIRLEIQPENRPDGLFKNIQDAVYAMRGRTRLTDDAAITHVLSEPQTLREPADWSGLPRDLYVTSVKTDGIVYDVQCCSVPMAIGPEVRYSLSRPESK